MAAKVKSEPSESAKLKSKPKSKKTAKKSSKEVSEGIDAEAEEADVAQLKARVSKKIVRKLAPTSSAAKGAGGAGAAPPKPTGIVDPASGLSGPGNVVFADSTGIFDCSLTFLDLSQNTDKYYLIQVIQHSENFTCFTRWGRTGTVGQSQSFGPFPDPADAIAAFKEKFLEKTGNSWDRKAAFSRQAGLYDFMLRDYMAIANKKKAKWQYYMDDGVDGKANGWYDYDPAAGDIVEGVYDNFLANPLNYNIRCVQSGSFTYQVNLSAMTQTNISHSARRQRQIRRFEV